MFFHICSNSIRARQRCVTTHKIGFDTRLPNLSLDHMMSTQPIRDDEHVINRDYCKCSKLSSRAEHGKVAKSKLLSTSGCNMPKVPSLRVIAVIASSSDVVFFKM